MAPGVGILGTVGQDDPKGGVHQKPLDERELVESIRGIRRGLEQANRGEGRPIREFFEELAKEQGISLK